MIRTGTGLGILAGITVSSLPILSGEAKELNQNRFFTSGAASDESGVRWGVMSILSCIPYMNPLAWVFAAVDDDEYSSLYYAYAVLYTAPYIMDGFKLDTFVVLSMMAGIAHVQIERLAMTEPVEVDVQRLVAWVGSRILLVFESLFRAGADLSLEVARRVEKTNSQMDDSSRPHGKE